MFAPFAKLPLDVSERVLLQIKAEFVAEKVLVESIVSIWSDRFRRAAIAVEDCFDFPVSRPNCGELADFAVYCFEVDEDKVSVGKLVDVITSDTDELWKLGILIWCMSIFFWWTCNFRIPIGVRYSICSRYFWRTTGDFSVEKNALLLPEPILSRTKRRSFICPIPNWRSNDSGTFYHLNNLVRFVLNKPEWIVCVVELR